MKKVVRSQQWLSLKILLSGIHPGAIRQRMQEQIQRKSALTGCAPIVEIAKNRSPGPSSSTQARNTETRESPGELYCADAAQMSDVESDELLTRIKFETAAMW